MSLQKFQGTGVAMVTPFKRDGSIDFNSLRGVINFLIEGDVEYLVVLGTTGESATIHGPEKQELFSYVAEVTDKRVPLVAGIGGNDTQEVLDGFKHFDLKGYDAILSVSPYYNKPSQEGLFRHYEALSNETPLPIIMYNVPSRTGMNVSAETTIRIAEECKNIIATKEASGNFDQLHQIIKYVPAEFGVISGDDAITLPIIACGGMGVISVVANAYPKLFSDMVRFCLNGDFESARPLHYQLSDIITSLFTEGSPGGVKAYMSEMGICENTFRLPVVPVSARHHEKIKTLMAGLKQKLTISDR
jgi:4-hydroxy-tetrahydrodipicolinate synthase